MDFFTEKTGKFGDTVVNVWQHGLMGVDVGRLVVAIGIFLLFFALRPLFTKAVVGVLQRWASRSITATDDIIVEAVQKPINFIPIVLGVFFSFEYMQPVGKLQTFTENLTISLITFTIFWGLYRLVEPFRFLLRRLEVVFSPMAVNWLVRGIKVLFILVGAATILETWGVKVAPLIAGLGLFGVAVALGAQDMFKNLIGGLLVIGEKRFNLGDWIKVEGVVEGTVEDIGFRSTMIRRFDKAPVYVPNSQLADKAVTNFSAMTHRRIYWNIKVGSDVPFSQLYKIRDEIESYIETSDEFANADKATTIVRITSFSDDSVGIMLYCFTNTTDWGEWLSVKERLAQKIKEILETEGRNFNVSAEGPEIELGSDKPETFVPPEDKEAEAKAEKEKVDEQKEIEKRIATKQAEKAAIEKELLAEEEELQRRYLDRINNHEENVVRPPAAHNPADTTHR